MVGFCVQGYDCSDWLTSSALHPSTAQCHEKTKAGQSMAKKIEDWF